MRHEVIEVTCDNCKGDIIHPTSDNVITITMESGLHQFESDWCDKCRAALKAKLVPSELTCHCGYVAKSERGLRQHQTKQSHHV